MQRANRVGDEIRKVIADLIQNEIKDPRMPELVSVVAVDASRDLSHARIYISVMGDEEARKNCAAALRSASPELHFQCDDSIERGIRISRLIDEALGEPDRQTKQKTDHEAED